MASPADLVEIMSHVTGLPLATVVDIDRRLVGGGLRAKGGRGFNAARMAPLDAARLLTAVLGSPQANSSVETVQRYADTMPDLGLSSEGLFGPTLFKELTALPAQHSFVDALEALIIATKNGTITAACDPGREPQVEVYAFTRATYGCIRIAGLTSGDTAVVEYKLPPAKGSAKRRGPPRPDEAPGDLEQSRRVGGRTIVALAMVLEGD